MPLGEFALIDRYFRAAGAPRADVVLGVGDDGAILRPPPGCDLIAVSDTLVEGVHFPPGSPAASVGHRALAVNLSDIAAMGATPAWALLALTLPQVDEAWLEDFARGFAALARTHEVALVGGDTTRGPLMINVQVMGFVPQGQALRRSGARPGDLLCVSGTPGDAAAGLRCLQTPGLFDASADQSIRAAWQALQQRFEYPTPRVDFGWRLAAIASACIDVSDGLACDLDKMLAASRCAAIIDVDALPRSAAMGALVETGALSALDSLRYTLGGGDDYELAFCVPTSRRSALDELTRAGAVGVIGEVMELKDSAAPRLSVRSPRKGLTDAALTDADLTDLLKAAVGFDHFAV